nr:ATP-binding cassette domain-containing protein [Verrucomicrobiota bacterium]
MALLEVTDVRRAFGGLAAVDGVSFTVKPGQIKGIIGPNGAGKTTLFNLISGLLKPDAGRITFRGRSITGLKPYEIAGAGLSRTFQNPSLFLQMNVLENVMVGRHCRTRWGFLGCGLRWPGQAREERAIREAARAQDERHQFGLLIASAALTLPLLLPMIVAPFGLRLHLNPWIELALATPVQFIVGARFYRGAWKALRAYSGNMDVLVALGTSAAYAFSVYMLAMRGAHASGHLYFEGAAAVITFVMF